MQSLNYEITIVDWQLSKDCTLMVDDKPNESEGMENKQIG